LQVGSTLLRFVIAMLMRGGDDGGGGGGADEAVDAAEDSLASLTLTSPAVTTCGAEAAAADKTVGTSTTCESSSAGSAEGRRTHAAAPDGKEAEVAAAAVGVPWCHTLVLQVHERNAAAIAFYKRDGFRVAGLLRDYYCSGAVADYGDGVQMERVLRPRPPSTSATSLTSSTSSAAAVRGATQSKAQKRNARRARTRAAGREGKAA